MTMRSQHIMCECGHPLTIHAPTGDKGIADQCYGTDCNCEKFRQQVQMMSMVTYAPMGTSHGREIPVGIYGLDVFGRLWHLRCKDDVWTWEEIKTALQFSAV